MSFFLNNWLAISFGVIGLITLVMAVLIYRKSIWRTRAIMERMYFDRERGYQIYREEEKRPEQEELAAALKDKKKQLLNLPNVSFHYVDEARVRNFYTDYFREPTVESMVRELVSEVSGGIKASLPQVLESRFGGTNLSKWISKIKLPETSLNGMFLKYLKETVRNNQVSLDLELLDVELSDIDKFQELAEKLERELEFVLEKESVSRHINRLKERAAERTLKKLESARGWAIIRGSFLISQHEDFYYYSNHHPVNQYLATQGQPVRIEATVPVDSILSHVAGNYKQSVGSTIPATIYGEVWQPINRETNMLTLKLTPLAIY